MSSLISGFTGYHRNEPGLKTKLYLRLWVILVALRQTLPPCKVNFGFSSFPLLSHLFFFFFFLHAQLLLVVFSSINKLDILHIYTAVHLRFAGCKVSHSGETTRLGKQHSYL